MVVMMREYVAQFYFVFPANVNTPHKAKFFKQADCSVQAGAVEFILALRCNVAH